MDKNEAHGIADVDVLMATFNGENFVREQIQSIVGQTFSNWRLLVSDDGSSDKTIEIVNSEIAKDARISWANHKSSHLGSYHNFLNLLRSSSASYSMFCDQDDVWNPDKIEVSLRKIQELENAFPSDPIMVFTDLEVVDENLYTIFPSFDKMGGIDPDCTSIEELLYRPVAPGCTIIINKQLRELVTSLLNEGGVEYHDWWVSLVASGLGHIGYVPVATIKYRQHNKNQVGAAKPSVVKSVVSTTVSSAKVDVLKSMLRARECYQSFGGLLAEEDRRSLQAYLSIPKTHGIGRLFLLKRAGIWKKGFVRKLGQALVTLTMSFPDEYDNAPA